MTLQSVIYVVFITLINCLIIVSSAFIPYVTRKTELFGVTVPSAETKRPELVALRASYRNRMLIWGAVLIALSVATAISFGAWSMPFLVIWMGALAAYLLITLLLYIPRHKAMREIKAQAAWSEAPQQAIVTASTTASSKDTVSPAWLLLFPLVIALWGLAIMAIWPDVPDPVPMQYGWDGGVTSTVPKGQAAVMMLVTEVFIAIVISGAYLAIRLAKRQIDAARPEESLLQNRRYRYFSSIMIIAIGVVSLAFIGATQIVVMTGSSGVIPILVSAMALVALVFVVVAVMMFKVGQGGSRLSIKQGSATDSTNYDDDRYWKLGLFYVNRDDPAIFVEKRFGVGWTNNYGRPLTWVILFAFLAFVVGFLALIYMLT